jgi:hypothetical protein
MKTSSRLLAAASVVALLVAACGGSGSRESAGIVSGELSSGGDAAAPGATFAPTTAAPPPVDQPIFGQPEAETSSDQDQASREVLASLAQVDIGRDIIFTGDLIVAVTDVVGAGEKAVRIIQSLGGFVFGQHTVGTPPESVFVFKVFPEDFQTALDRLGALGEIRTQSVSAEDVTERIVDLQSRINTAAASVERLQEFLARADSVETVAALENQLLERETQLETLRGQLRTVQDQVGLATVVLTLTEPTIRPELRLDVTAYFGHDGPDATGLACPGSTGLSVVENDELTFCFEITNTGDTNLAGIQLKDPILNVTLPDLVIVSGEPSETLEPGQSLLLAYEAVATRDIRTKTTVTAKPVTEEGTPLPGRDATATLSITIDTSRPAGIPTFNDGLRASWELLLDLIQVLVLALGGLIPFVWIPVGIYWLVRRRGRRPIEAPPSPVTPRPSGLTESEPLTPVGATELAGKD